MITQEQNALILTDSIMLDIAEKKMKSGKIKKRTRLRRSKRFGIWSKENQEIIDKYFKQSITSITKP